MVASQTSKSFYAASKVGSLHFRRKIDFFCAILMSRELNRNTTLSFSQYRKKLDDLRAPVLRGMRLYMEQSPLMQHLEHPLLNVVDFQTLQRHVPPPPLAAFHCRAVSKEGEAEHDELSA